MISSTVYVLVLCIKWVVSAVDPYKQHLDQYSDAYSSIFLFLHLCNCPSYMETELKMDIMCMHLYQILLQLLFLKVPRTSIVLFSFQCP